MTIGLLLTILFACLHWINGASQSVANWDTWLVFLPIIIEFSLYFILIWILIKISIKAEKNDIFW